MTKPARIGDILRTLTGLTDEQVAEAGAYKFEHDDILLGEACVRLGFVSRASLEVSSSLTAVTGISIPARANWS